MINTAAILCTAGSSGKVTPAPAPTHRLQAMDAFHEM